LLEHFPGRFLDEIDGMDWGRYMRAMKARRVERTETQRRIAIDDPDKMTAELARLILEHDELVANGE